MKKIFLFASFVMPLIGVAQSKLSYDLVFCVSGVNNTSSRPVSKSFPRYVFDSSGSPIFITPGSGSIYTVAVPQTAVKYKSKLSGAFTIGGKLNYNAHKNFGIVAGASFSYFKAVRSAITTTGSFTSSLSFTGILYNSSGNWDSTRSYSPGTYTYSNGIVSEEKFKFLTVNIPVAVNYSIAKWQLEAGITTSFILNSKRTQISKKGIDPEMSATAPSSDPGVPQPSPDNKIKSFFFLSISPQYQLSNKLKIGIEYNRALTSAYSTNWYSQDVYPGMKTSSLGLKILYKLK